MVREGDIESWVNSFLLQSAERSPEGLSACDSDEPTLGLFINNDLAGRRIDSAEALPVTLSRAIAEFDRLSPVDGSFIGFRRRDGRVLQLACDGDKKLDADIPIPAREDSLQRSGSRDDLRSLIQMFANGTPVEGLPSF